MGTIIKESGIVFNIKRFSVHDGPGIRTSIFLKGCLLSCTWCHNPEGIDPEITIWYNRNICIACGSCVLSCPNGALVMRKGNDGKYVEINRNFCDLTGNCVKRCPAEALEFTGMTITIDELMDEIRKDLIFYQTSGGGVTLTGGEPLYQKDFCIGILNACKKENISTALETSLYCEREILEYLAEVTDFFLVDIKIFDPLIHKQYTGQHNYIIKENLEFLAEMRKDILVRVPLVKGITDSPSNIEEIEKFVRGLKLSAPVEYLVYNPLARSKYLRLSLPFLQDEKF